MLELITFGLVESIIALIFGIVTVCSFAGVLVKKNWLKILYLLLITLSVQTVIFLTMGYDLTHKLYPLHTHLVLIVCVTEFFKIRLFYSFIYTMLAYLSYQIPAWISHLIYLVFPKNELVQFIFFLIIIVLTIYFIIMRVGNSANELLGRGLGTDLFFGLIPVLYYIFDYVSTVWTDALYVGNYHVVAFMPVVICAAYVIYLSVLSREHSQRVEAVVESTIIDNEMSIVQNEIENLNELQQMAKLYRNDINNHFATILEYVNAGDTKKAIEYINESIKAVDKITPHRFCENEMFNLILAHFAQIAEQEDYDYSFKVESIDNIPLTNIELCAIVSNTLENAFNEMGNLEDTDKKVELLFGKHNGMLVYTVTNSCRSDFVLKGDRPESQKGEGHGFGTKSIVSIVHGHGGIVDFRAENGIFEIMITVPL